MLFRATGAGSAGILGDGRVTVAPEKRRRRVGRASGAEAVRWPRMVVLEEIRRTDGRGRPSYNGTRRPIVKTVLLVVGIVWLVVATGASFLAGTPTP